MAEERLTFQGRFHRTDAAEIQPKPAHSIPIWLGTVGPRGLAMTGQLADGWIPSLEYAPPDQVPEMLRRIFDAARAAGREPDDIRRIYNIQVRVGRPVPGAPLAVTGTAEELAGRLSEFVSLGFDGFNFISVGPDDGEQAERLGREVIPHLNALS